METSFHYEVYRNIIAQLLKNKVRCELIINDLIKAHEPKFLNEMLTLLGKLNVAGLDCILLSTVLRSSKTYSCVVSPYYIRYIKDITTIHVRALYGLAKNHWNHAEWNKHFSAILCYSHYTKDSLSLDDKTHIVGNPRFDSWHNKNYAKELPAELNLSREKKTIVYAPTYGELSSIIPWAERLGRLSAEYNIIAKLHHGTLYKNSEAKALKLAKRHFKKIITDNSLTFTLLHHADYIITDNSGFIFDAINADKKLIIVDWPEMTQLLKDRCSFSSIDSPEQQVRSFIPVARDMLDIRKYLADDYNWKFHEDHLRQIKIDYCDAFNDGLAGKRAAHVIINEMNKLPTSFRS